MRSQIVYLRVSARLLQQLDKAAKANYQTRSGFIRQSIALRLNSQRVIDEPTEDEVLKSLGIL
ncbi:hypothetical protein COY17_02700 [Candidatus Saccharibacteria bacterium CG_4_10_14_0_2_um_filter_52_9]|nr:MAG: hypothetical protein COY17_02700 [Candidatus Saccharibacteria bacterium CG_4_10_14_0_2_um_filter_52_9]